MSSSASLLKAGQRSWSCTRRHYHRSLSSSSCLWCSLAPSSCLIWPWLSFKAPIVRLKPSRRLRKKDYAKIKIVRELARKASPVEMVIMATTTKTSLDLKTVVILAWQISSSPKELHTSWKGSGSATWESKLRRRMMMQIEKRRRRRRQGLPKTMRCYVAHLFWKSRQRANLAKIACLRRRKRNRAFLNYLAKDKTRKSLKKSTC